MGSTHRGRSPRTAAAALLLAVALAACGGGGDATTSASPAAGAGDGSEATGAGEGGGGRIGLDLPRADSDFWTAYATYVPQVAEELGVDLMAPTSSQGDIAALASNVDALIAQGAEAIVIAPQDTGAVSSTIQSLNEQGIPVVSIDTAPEQGDVFMVVRADNVAMGRQGCEHIGEQLGGEGTVVEFQGGLDSINGRDRSEGFKACMDENYPNIQVFQEPTEWDGARAASALETRLTQTGGEVDAIFMPAGGVYLQPTLQVLEGAGKLIPRGEDGHVVIVSVDGIPAEFEAIRAGHIDAAVSQPADLYARYGLFYAQAALAGETFQPGPTDHDSTIVEVREGVLEDQLPSVLVTADNVDDASLWGNQS
jgi:ribose transport system substrate-binding protein